MSAAISTGMSVSAAGATNRRRMVYRTTQPNARPITIEAIAANDFPGSRSLSRSASAPRPT
jgi:hypothetical protein